MRKYFLKVITGFREDQYVIIPMQEAHKAYYLFRNPEERGIFENGVALIGKNIQEIKPAWNETMGYNPTYQLTSDDWNEINKLGVSSIMNDLVEKAKNISHFIQNDKTILQKRLQELLPLFENKQLENSTKSLVNKVKIK